MSVQQPDDHRLDHVVVLMFENRSFDHLLGSLYAPGEVPEFEGVLGRTLWNPTPPGADVAGRVLLHPSPSMVAPYPDPGEEYPHVNTQLFGTVEPESNRLASVRDMRAPFNAPPTPTPTPAMGGFVTDYAGAVELELGRPARPEEYAQAMAVYTPAQVPVLSALARGFTCFDHWFCEVPSQTYANRCFFHAATSSGFVLNGNPPGKFALRNDARTLFEQLEEAHRSWRVYIDPAQLLSATALIHARRLAPFFATRFGTIFDFYEDARTGELPNYAFIEPNMFHPHTDMHPPSGARVAEALHLRPPDALAGGERLLAEVYAAVRGSASPGGSNWENTALLVTFDEHGGTFDHVPPPPAVPPDGSPTEMGFAFDRLGARVPTILVSAWSDARVVATAPFRSTSLLRTLRDWWQLGAPLTRRDADAPSFLPLLTRSTARPPTDWPTVAPRTPGRLQQAEEAFLRSLETLTLPIERLESDLLGEGLAHEARLAGTAPRADAQSLSHREAHEHIGRIGSALFPGVVRGAQSRVH